MELRGFDSYPITLGDEMRGERASLGKSLEDAERDLRIKAKVIVAVENCDLEGFPNRSVVSGYVRSYARYLGMDVEDCFQRFCEESGYQSPTSLMMAESGDQQRGGARGAGDRQIGAELARSRFASPPPRNRFQARVSMGALTSTLALLGLIAGLSYGGYALLQDIQRVGFAPLPEAPAVVADAPLISMPDVETATLSRPEPDDYLGGGVLAAVAMPVQQVSPVQLRRDGPISAIDPRTAGVFVPPVAEPMIGAPSTGEPRRIRSADDAIREAQRQARIARADAVTDLLPEPEPEPEVKGVALHASEEAWVRVSSRGTVIFEGILSAGEHYELPDRVDSPVLKAGNAGGVFIFVDGVAYGPIGRRGQVVRDVSLAAGDVRDGLPEAASPAVGTAITAFIHERAEAAAAAER